MALKDLIVDSGSVTEAAIEDIVSTYVNYEVNPHAIVFTPAGNGLGNTEKVIVYATAVLGWKFVVDEPPPVSTKPSDLEDSLSIAGGTLRPILKKLKDNHILAVSNGHYSIRISNLAVAGRLVGGEKNVLASSSKSKRAKMSDTRKAAKTVGKNGLKSKKKARAPIRASLERLLSDGFFSEFRTLTQILGRLHELAINVKMTSISGPVAELVREGRLERKKINDNGKQVWAYRSS